MADTISDRIEWDAPETRQLPLLTGGEVEVHGTRHLWHSYDTVMYYGAWSYRDLLDMVVDEQDRNGGDFTRAFQAVIAWRAADVRLWLLALEEKNRDILDHAGERFRTDFTQAVAN